METTTAQALLLADPEISPEAAAIIQDYLIEAGDHPDDPGLGALIEKNVVGVGKVTTSRRLGNLIVNWRDLVTKAVPALTATTALAALAGPLGALAAVGLCLRAVGTLVDATEVKLSPQHAKVVRVMWSDDFPSLEVPVAALREKLAGEIPEEELTRILDDLRLLKVIAFKTSDVVEKREKLIIK